MKFKTLEELQAHNKKVLEVSPFGKLINQQEPDFNEDGLTHFEKITRKSQPHQSFNLDWSIYYSLDFADRFLPKVGGYECKGVHFYDGAELLNGLQNSPRKLLGLSDNDELINIITCTYPKNVEAGLKKNRVQPSGHEICVFIEVDEIENSTISFKFGTNFKDFLSSQKLSATSLEEKSFKSNISEIKNHFNRTLSHDNMLRFVLKTINIEKEVDNKTESFEKFEDTFKTLNDDFGAGEVKEKHPDAFGHGDIENIALKNAGFTKDEIDQVYYGNWLRDFSQIIVADTVGFNHKDQNIFQKHFKGNDRVKKLLPSMSCKPSHDTWIKIINLLAVKEFIYNPKKKKGSVVSQNLEVHQKDFDAKFGKLTKDILGIYRPEEHLDNPKGLINDEVFAHKSLQNPIQFKYEFEKGKTKIKTLYNGENSNSLLINDEKLMKRFIVDDINIENEENRPSSLTYLKQQLHLAKKKGKTKDGLRHFGAALHVLEDYFAHTNFIEIALIKNGYIDVFPWVQLDAETEKIKNGKEKSSKIPIVSGLFGSDDTIASITPKIAEELFPLGYKEYQSIGEKERTFFDSLVISLLEDLASKEKVNTSNSCLDIDLPLWNDLSYKTLLKTYNNYLSYRDFWAHQKKNKFYGFVIRGISIIFHYISQTLSFFSDVTFNIILNSIEDGIKEKQTRVIQNFGTNPTHTQIAKDPVEHPLNNLAGTLAVKAVEDIGKKMRSSWSGGLSIDYIIKHIEKTYFVHPKNTTWMDKTIKDWALKNKKSLDIAKSKTQIYHHEKQIKKTFKKYENEIENIKNPPKK